jgi:hypothetical protein
MMNVGLKWEQRLSYPTVEPDPMARRQPTGVRAADRAHHRIWVRGHEPASESDAAEAGDLLAVRSQVRERTPLTRARDELIHRVEANDDVMLNEQ